MLSSTFCVLTVCQWGGGIIKVLKINYAERQKYMNEGLSKKEEEGNITIESRLKNSKIEFISASEIEGLSLHEIENLSFGMRLSAAKLKNSNEWVLLKENFSADSWKDDSCPMVDGELQKGPNGIYNRAQVLWRETNDEFPF